MPEEPPPPRTCKHCGQALQLVKVHALSDPVWLHRNTPHGKLYLWCRLFEAEPAVEGSAL